jgi:diguanylate cyclase (GGDEF)-like protein
LLLASRQAVPPLDRIDAHHLDLAAAQAANILQRVFLHREVALDHLTGLNNRGCAERLLSEELAYCGEHERSLSLIMVDVDHFKHFNDTYGHHTGDAVLRLVAQALRGALRQDDVLGRWGGEEFLVVLPGTGARGAEAVAAKIKAAVSDISGLEEPVSVSAGIAVFPEHALAAAELVECADLALYQAKASGRDCYRLFDPPPATDPATGSTPAPDLVLGQVPPDFEAEMGDLTRTSHFTTLSPRRWEAKRWLSCPPLPPSAIDRPLVLIGRGDRCDVWLPHPDVSRVHALIRAESEHGPLAVEDPGSCNGVFVNGLRVQSAELVVGDVVQVGPYELSVQTEPGTRGEGTRTGVTLRHLQRCGLAVILRELQAERHVGLLSLRVGRQAGELVLEEGEPVAARFEELRGEEALLAMLALKAGLCSISSSAESTSPDYLDGPVKQRLSDLLRT